MQIPFELTDEEVDALHKAYRQEQKRRWYYSNRDKCLAQAKGWRQAHKPRLTQAKAAWDKRNPHKRIETRWKRAGIKEAKFTRYTELNEQQGGVCAICGAPPKTRRLAWDHNHLTGQSRGLLCGSCNIRLGWFEKLLTDEVWFEKASTYLDKWASSSSLSE